MPALTKHKRERGVVGAIGHAESTLRVSGAVPVGRFLFERLPAPTCLDLLVALAISIYLHLVVLCFLYFLYFLFLLALTLLNLL